MAVEIREFLGNEEDWHCGRGKPILEKGREETIALLREKIQSREGEAKLAYVGGEYAGFIQYYKTDASPAKVAGENTYYICCMEVLEKHRGQGVGRALLDAAMAEMKDAKGVAVSSYQDTWMSKSYFLRQGFQVVAEEGPMSLLFKRFTPDAQPPRQIEQSFRASLGEGQVVLDTFPGMCQCPFSLLFYERVKKIAREEGAEIREHPLKNRSDLIRYGVNPYATLINGKDPWYDPTIPDDQIRAYIRKAKDESQPEL
ncbi:MAG: GNAT family N-acetyltransferase [Aigarchaeota archaeon]|nr:GNAT family N-acetyltransferase [Aigarchaeota archaeon]